MFYVQHLLGIGHLMRARLVARALIAAGFRVHLVSGGLPVGGYVPSGVEVLQLPPIRADATLKPLRDPSGQPIDDAYRQQRRDSLLAAFASIAPTIVLFETFPFGRRALRFEIVPLLERIAATRPKPLVVASVRDILQARNNIEREREMLDAANRWFDAILVHGDIRFADFAATFPLARDIIAPIHYTGFVRACDASLPATEVPERREVVVSAGGGAVGMDLIRVALAAREQSRFGHLQWRILVGNNVADDDYRKLLAMAGTTTRKDEISPPAIVERARLDFAALLRGALVSISQAGYNTVLDVLTSGARGVFVPFAAHGETEQRARANRLHELNLGVIIDETDLSPVTLAAAVDDAGSREEWGRWDYACDGASRSALLIAALAGVDVGQRAKV